MYRKINVAEDDPNYELKPMPQNEES